MRLKTRTAVFGSTSLLVLLSGAVLGWWIVTGETLAPGEQLQVGLRIARNGDYATAAQLARSLDEAKLKKRSEVSTRHFLIGADAYQSARGIQHRPSRMENHGLAVEHLQKSHDLRFPSGYEGIGNYFLGMALFELFRWKEAQKPLEIASERWPQGRNDAIECLIDIELYGKTPDPEEAMERADRWAAFTAWSPEELDRIALKRMEILFAQGTLDAIPAVADSIGNRSPYRPGANLILARCIREQAHRLEGEPQKERLLQALARLDESDRLMHVSIVVRRRSLLEQGIINRELGRHREAISMLSSLRLSAPFEPESMMAGVEEIDALIDIQMFSETTETLTQMKKSFVDPKWYENSWMPVPVMRRRLLESANRILVQEDFPAAEAFASSLPKICDEIDQLRLQFTVHDRWARKARREKSESLGTSAQDRGPDSERIERSFRLAGQALEKLCRLDMRAPDFMELMWLGIEDYHLANDYPSSNRLIELYVGLAPRDDQARAWLMQSKNFAAMGEEDRALRVIEKLLLSNPDSPLIPEAKLTAAKLHWNQGRFQEAERLIAENLYSGVLRPDSETWKESLLQLGTLMYRQGEQMQVRALGTAVDKNARFQDAFAGLEQSFHQLIRSIDSMEEGLRRFQQDPRRFQLLYMTAKAYRMASYWPETLLRENRLVSEDSIAQWKNKRKELLVRSRDTFATLRREINTQEDGGKKIPNSESLLCNSYFGEADLLFDEGNYLAAMDAYRSAANRFIHEPESLEAFVQIARCQEQMGQSAEMRRTLEMALDILSRIPADRDERFLKNTRQSRSGWEDQLRWMLTEADRREIR